MPYVDVLIIAALQEEFEAARAAAGIAWTPHEADGDVPYVRGDYRCADGRVLSVALARPVRMGGRSAGPLATSLTRELRPGCLAMSGVCAGNPSVVALGDVIVAEVAYEYDEGKQTPAGFTPDHRQYRLDADWFRAAQEFDPAGLPSHGAATEQESRRWFLERLMAGQNPREHPARSRYFPPGAWPARLSAMESEGLVGWTQDSPTLTERGRSFISRTLYDDVDGPGTLPYAVVAGPVASGSAVVGDGATWERLKASGVRTVAGLDMEAATIATVAEARKVPQWLVVKGVVDHADATKDDRYQRFAARASAEVLFALLDRLAARPEPRHDPAARGHVVHAHNVRGLMVGDGNMQHNTFN